MRESRCRFRETAMRRLCIVAVVALLAAPSRAGEPDATSLIDLQGGGFIFNYNIGEVFYGVLIKPRRALPVGTEVEARFEDPAGGPPIVVTETFRGGPRPLSLRTPPVQGNLPPPPPEGRPGLPAGAAESRGEMTSWKTAGSRPIWRAAKERLCPA